MRALVDEAVDGAPGSHELAELLHRRTGGTPLFVTQLLESFYVEQIIDIHRTSGRWRIDVERAHQHESSGDVVEYLAARFTEMPEPTRRVLATAACIGPTFELEHLRDPRRGSDDEPRLTRRPSPRVERRAAPGVGTLAEGLRTARAWVRDPPTADIDGEPVHPAQP